MEWLVIYVFVLFLCFLIYFFVVGIESRVCGCGECSVDGEVFNF